MDTEQLSPCSNDITPAPILCQGQAQRPNTTWGRTGEYLPAAGQLYGHLWQKADSMFKKQCDNGAIGDRKVVSAGGMKMMKEYPKNFIVT